jgi:hypothetical protein
MNFKLILSIVNWRICLRLPSRCFRWIYYIYLLTSLTQRIKTVNYIKRLHVSTDRSHLQAFIYSGPAGYDRLDIRPTWVTTKIFILTYDQISSYDQRQCGEHISGTMCSSLRALAVFALFCRHDHANSSYQSMYNINKYRVTEKGCVSLTARSSINQALRPAWRS